MKKSEQAHVTAHGLTLEGEGVADFSGRTLSCPGLFPGESGLVRVEALSRQHARAYASLLELTAAHSARRSAPCPRHVGRGGSCGGCALMELDESAQRSVKRELLRAQFGLEVDQVEPAGPALGYRWSSKRVALRVGETCMLGSYARRSHKPAPMTGCMVEHPRLREAFDFLERLLQELEIVPFDERSGSGDLRYVWGKTDGGRVIVTLITARAESRAARVLPESLQERREQGHEIAGLCWSVQSASGNAVRGGAPKLLWGQEELETSILGHKIPLGALGFLQPNPEVAELAYRALTAADGFQGRRELAFDLYAGAGVTTEELRRSFAQVVPCEAYPESAQKLGIEARDVADFLEAWLREQQRVPDLVVANPPRKGLGQRVCAALASLSAPELRIMSCGPEGLARDLQHLAARYELLSLHAFDTLPQTPHVELVAHLARRSKRAGPRASKTRP